jgi:hypothetical protein
MLSGRDLGWKLVEEITISVAAQTLDFTYAIPSTVKSIKVDAHLINDQAGSTNYCLRLNGADIAGRRQYINSAGAAVSGANDASVTFAGLKASGSPPDECDGEIVLNYPGTGIQRIINTVASASASSTNTLDNFRTYMDVTTPTTATAITSAGIGASTASGIGVGTMAKLWILE